MLTTVFLESITTAVTLGLGCGTGCGGGITTILYGYIACHTKNAKESALEFTKFFLGKVSAVVLLCLLSSALGQNLIDASGTLLGINVHILVDIFMIALGIYLLIGWKREKRCKSSCHACKPIKEFGHKSLYSIGFGYGISPCAPLIVVTGFAATLPIHLAVSLGFVFSIASTLSPTLIFALLSGVLGGRMNKEIPEFITWFRLACYIGVILLFGIGLIKEVI